MRFTSTFGALAAIAAVASAQANPGDASDADAQLAADQLTNIGAATAQLDSVVLAFTGAADGPALQSASDRVFNALTTGIANVNTIQGNITFSQGLNFLLNPTFALNANVTTAVNDTINKKPILVDACLGPTVLATFQQQLNTSIDFRNAVAGKFEESNRGLVTSLSQQSIDNLQFGVGNFSDQTTLPASCTPTSSAVASATASPSALPTTSDADIAIVLQQFQNIIDATTTLDNAINAYTGPADTADLQTKSDNVLTVINNGVAAVNGISPYITLGQALGFLGPLDTLKNLVNTTVTNATTAKPLFVQSCIGPAILQSLVSQNASASAFSLAIANKIDPAYRDLSISLAQPIQDSLAQGIAAYADQTSLPASCTATSSAVVSTSSAAPVVSSTSVAPSTTAVVSSAAPSTSSAAPLTSSNIVPSSTYVAPPVVSSTAVVPVSSASPSTTKAASSTVVVPPPVSSTTKAASSTVVVPPPVSSTTKAASSTVVVPPPVSSTTKAASSTVVVPPPVSSTTKAASSTVVVPPPVSSATKATSTVVVPPPSSSATKPTSTYVAPPPPSSTGKTTVPVVSPSPSVKTSVPVVSPSIKTTVPVVSIPTTVPVVSIKTSVPVISIPSIKTTIPVPVPSSSSKTTSPVYGPTTTAKTTTTIKTTAPVYGPTTTLITIKTTTTTAKPVTYPATTTTKAPSYPGLPVFTLPPVPVITLPATYKPIVISWPSWLTGLFGGKGY